MTNTITNIFSMNTISAADGWGIDCAYGVSDSLFINNYIHTNSSGGIRFTGGSFYNQIHGGKIEDNYRDGIQVNGANGGSSAISVTGTQFHRNNGPAIRASNGGEITLVNVALGNNGLTKTGSNKAHLVVDVGGGKIVAVSPIFNSSVEYLVSAIYGTIHLSTANLPKGTSDYFYKGSGKVYYSPDVLFDGVPRLINYAARKRKVTIGASSSGNVTFSNFVNIVESGYFALAEYELRVLSNQFPNSTAGYSKRAVYTVVLGASGSFANKNVSLLTDIVSNDTNWISGVSVSLGGVDNNDLIVTITTGASVGDTSGMTDFHVSLIDRGNTGYGLL